MDTPKLAQEFVEIIDERGEIIINATAALTSGEITEEQYNDVLAMLTESEEQ